MTTVNQEFDPHASIKRLAEAERKCPRTNVYPGGHGLIEANKGIGGSCLVCGGTGRIVPFASLRIYPGHGSCREDSPCKQVWKPGVWIPEPDVEKACWRVFEVIADQIEIVRWQPHYAGRGDMQEAVLRAAEAWVKEKP